MIFFVLILAMGFAVEEKRLADDRLQTLRFERFGNQKSGLWRRSCQKPFRIGGDENHRHGKRFENLIDRLETRAAVRELNIRENEARPVAVDSIDRLAMGARDIDDPVPLLFDEILKIERDERLILDDQDIGANLIRDLLSRGINQAGCLVDRAVERARDFLGVEAFERTQEKRNARPQRDRFETAVRARLVAGERGLIDMVIDRHRPPDLEEQAVKRRFWIGAFRKFGRIGDNRLERSKHIGISPGLGSR